ncbi:outer membrane protein assembly factor BamB family protein [Streptacidiphilus sp. PAMC 29251]
MTDGASAVPPQAPPPPPPAGYVPVQGYPPAAYTPTQAYPQPGPPPQPPYGGYGPPQPQLPYPQQSGYPPPQPPYPQAGYAPPGYPPPPAAGRRGIGKGGIIGIIAGVVVIAVIATLVIAITSKSGSKGPGGRTLSTAWTVPSSGSDDRIIGSWLTPTTLVRAGTQGGVSGYDPATGHKTWTLTPPAGAATPCAMSEGVNTAGIGAMAFGTNANSCTYFVAVDSATGKILWKIALTNTEHPLATQATVLIQGSVATVLSLGRAGGFDARTGKQIWINASRGDYCTEDAYGTTGVVVIEDYCSGISPAQTMTALNASTGKRLWRRTITGTAVEGYVLNASPLVAQLSPDFKAPVSVYSSTGTPTAFDMTGFDLSEDSEVPVKLAGQTLVVQGGEDTENASSDTTAGQIIAYNLTDGQQLWRYNGESGHGAVLARPASDGNLYALSTGTYSGSPHYVRLDPVTGKSTILGTLPSDAEGWTVSGGSLYALPGGGLLMLNSFASSSIPAVESFK